MSRGNSQLSQETIYAFIDSQNLNLQLQRDVVRKDKTIYTGWKLDFARFYQYLRDKYSIKKAFLFIGYKPDNTKLYQFLEYAGYHLVYKPIIMTNGKIKGNVDAELVLHSMIEYNNYDKALIISGDGDFYCLVQYLLQQGKLSKILIPNKYCYSSLLKEFSSYMDFINMKRKKLELKQKKQASA